MSSAYCGCDPEALPPHICGIHTKWPDWGKKAEPELRPALRQFETGATRDINHDKYESVASIRVFDTGATRDEDDTKMDYEGFLSPLVLERYAAYMHKNRIQKDGSTRDSDNWQKGIPLTAYMKSLLRHVFALWYSHRYDEREDIEDQLAAIIFNVQGYLHEILLEKKNLHKSRP